jgi:hypothetical protein
LPLLWHWDTFPVSSTTGVSYPWHVQPLTTTGAPPPFPGTCPSLILAAYSFSTWRAVWQFTEPMATLMTTGTPAAVCVLPQAALAVGCPDEHPAASQAASKQTPSPQSTARVRRTPSRSTVSP